MNGGEKDIRNGMLFKMEIPYSQGMYNLEYHLEMIIMTSQK